MPLKQLVTAGLRCVVCEEPEADRLPLTPETLTNRPASARVLAETRKTAITEEPKQPWWNDLILLALMVLGIALPFFIAFLLSARTPN
jgi:hypothetical protein